MISGVLVDVLLVLGPILAFGWAGLQLGTHSALVRLAGSLAGLLVAVALRDPVGRVFGWVLPVSDDFARLLAMLLVGIAAYVGVAMPLRWWLERRAVEQFDSEQLDLLEDPRVGAAAGALTGLAWGLAFVAVLILLPSDNVLSRGAIRSATGTMLVAQEGVLRWIQRGFPHYTQTLPKGEDGAVVGPLDRELVLHADEDPEVVREDAVAILDSINSERVAEGVLELQSAPQVTEVAESHAVDMLRDGFLGETAPGGRELSTLVLEALGDRRGRYAEDVGVVTIWAHGPANAFQAIVEDDQALATVLDGNWSEAAVGAADGGWFAGRMYVVVLLASLGDPAFEVEDDTDELPEAIPGEDGVLELDGGDGELAEEPAASTDEELETLDGGMDDLDGDGVPDELQ